MTKEAAMRFIHMADLHLGRQLNDVSMLPDQEAVLDQIISIAQRERPDAALIAGDVYQRSSPQAEAVALFDRFVSRLAALDIKVFVISGNHDSAERISYFSSLIRSSGVYVTEAFDGTPQKVTLKDIYGDIHIWMLPFLRLSRIRRFLPGERITTCQEGIEAVLRQADIDLRARNVMICHQFITGSETSESEEMSVGGLDNIDAAVFGAFDYVALGHIHKPQRVGRDTLRYAGSPLKYSFSESTHKKSVTIVDMGPKGDVDVRAVPLYPLRDVRQIEGTIEEIMRMDYSEDYVWITIHDEAVPPDARVTLSVNFPNIMKFSVVNSKTKYDLDVINARDMESMTVTELFESFYRLQNNDVAPGSLQKAVFDKVLKGLEEDR